MNRYALILLIAVLVSGCATTSLTKTAPRLSDYRAGIFSVEETEIISAPRSLSGKQLTSSGWRLEKATSDIPAQLGTIFGVGIQLDGPPIGSEISTRVVWKYPVQGITNPETDRTAHVSEMKQTCFSGRLCHVGQSLAEEWELEPGTWEMEMWVGSRAVFSHSFRVYVPGTDISTPPKLSDYIAGIFSVAETEMNEVPKSITGKQGTSWGWQLEKATTDIPARLGTIFGVGVKLEGPPKGSEIPTRMLWKYPVQGITNPETGRTAHVGEMKQTCISGRLCHNGQSFLEPWELVPGTWEIEVWVGPSVVFSHSFRVYLTHPETDKPVQISD